MSKRLVLLRHGKSDWSSGVSDDHDRPLKGRGRRAARVVGRLLSSMPPDLVVASTAVRARTTAEIAIEAGAWGSPFELDESLYEASVPSVLTFLRGLDDRLGTVLLVGHEPTWSALAGELVGGAGRPPRLRVPTGALVAMALESWSTAAPGAGRLEWLVPPRLLEGLADT